MSVLALLMGMLLRLKRALGRQLQPPQRQLTTAQLRQRLELSQAIVEYARLIQNFYHHQKRVIVGVRELATRFRQNPTLIKDALSLLSENGRATIVEKDQLWEVLPNAFVGDDDKLQEGAA